MESTMDYETRLFHKVEPRPALGIFYPCSTIFTLKVLRNI